MTGLNPSQDEIFRGFLDLPFFISDIFKVLAN